MAEDNVENTETVKSVEKTIVVSEPVSEKKSGRTFSLLIRSCNSLPILNLCLASFHQAAKNPENLEFIIVSTSDASQEAGNVKHIKVGKEVGATEALNLAASKSTGDVLWVLTDEYLCLSQDWDAEINSALDKHSDGLAYLMVDDNLHNKVEGAMEKYGCTVPVITRTAYDRLDCVYVKEVPGGGADTATFQVWQKAKPKCIMNLADKIQLGYTDRVKWQTKGGPSELNEIQFNNYVNKLS